MELAFSSKKRQNVTEFCLLNSGHSAAGIPLNTINPGQGIWNLSCVSPSDAGCAVTYHVIRKRPSCIGSLLQSLRHFSLETSEFRHSIPILPRPPQTASSSLRITRDLYRKCSGPTFISHCAFLAGALPIKISRYSPTDVHLGRAV